MGVQFEFTSSFFVLALYYSQKSGLSVVKSKLKSRFFGEKFLIENRHHHFLCSKSAPGPISYVSLVPVPIVDPVLIKDKDSNVILMSRDFLSRAVCSVLVTVTFMCFINVNDFLIIAFKLRFCFSFHRWFLTNMELTTSE